LSSVFGFIKQSGGHIQVSSKEGVGTTFRIYLPTKSPRPDRLDVSSVTIPASQGKVILCVEDDPIVRKFVSEQVCRFGYRTIVANDAREALSIVEGNADIDLLFSDVVMPGGMDGWQLADHVAQRRPDLPVLLTTGYSDVLTDRVDSRAHLLLLPKPYRSRELESMIRLALDAHPSSPEAMANSHSASSWHISDLA
jgi:CheY-like chemotaxis protein